MLLSSLLFAPLLTAALTIAAPKAWAKHVALIGALATLVLCWPLYRAFDANMAGLQLQETAAWLPSLGINFGLGIDGIALALLLLNNLLTPLVVLAAWREDRNPGAFFACLLGLAGLVNGVFMATDFILFYVFFEASLIPLYLLIGLWAGLIVFMRH